VAAAIRLEPPVATDWTARPAPGANAANATAAVRASAAQRAAAARAEGMGEYMVMLFIPLL
jgi:hypothetical protein